MAKAAAKKTKAAEPVKGPTPPSAKDSRPRVSLKWSDKERPGLEWISTTTPKGECAPARIRISSRNSDGSYSYFCYRDAKAVAVVHDLETAKDACERGPNPKLSDSVTKYVEENPGEIPPFLALTEGERRAVRAQYPYAAPSAAKVERVIAGLGKRGAADMDDAGTRRLVEQLAAAGASPGEAIAGRRAKPAPKPAKAALESLAGKLVRAKEGNPKKAGTAAHKRWEALFAACGGTVEKYRAGGGNMETLANAIAQGYVKTEDKK